MTPQEKEIYQKQANPSKPKVEKYTSQGVSLSALETQRLEKQKEIEEMNLDVDSILDRAVKDESK